MKKEKNNKKLFIAILLIIIVAGVISYFIYKNTDTSLFHGNNQVIGNLDLTNQDEIDTAIKIDLETNKYDLNNAKVYLNPYGNAPLSALIIFKTDKKQSGEITIKGKDNNDVVYTFEESIEHYVPVYGLYNDYNNEVIIKLTDGTSKNLNIQINADDNVKYFTAESTKIDEDKISIDNLYFISSPLSMNSFALDTNGEVRWYLINNYFHDIVFLDNGHMLIGTGDTNKYGLATKVVEMDMIGRIYTTYEIDKGYLNSIYRLDNGSILVASKNPERNTYSDLILEIDAKTGKIVKSTDVYQILSEIDSTLLANAKDNYFYNSGIDYESSSDSLILTYWEGEMVLNIDYSDGTLNWIFTNPENLTANFDSYELKGTDGFTYPTSMHSASLNSNTLKVFNNGYSTIKNESKIQNVKSLYSEAVTYEIDGKTIKLVSTLEENKSNFSYALADYVSTDNSELVLFGRELKDADYTKDDDINDYLNYSLLNEYVDGVKVLSLKFNEGSLTVSKHDMNSNNVFNFDTPQYYSTLMPSSKEELTSEIIKNVKKAEDTINYEFGFTNNSVIENNVVFMDVEEAKLVLISDLNEGAVYTIKEKDKEKVEKIVTDLDQGRYYIYVIDNGIYYKTSSYIDIK